jgi:hypothetical protein
LGAGPVISRRVPPTFARVRGTIKLDHEKLTLWALWDSNPGPTDYESAALTV